MYIYMYVYIYMYIYIFMCVCVCVCVCVYAALTASQTTLTASQMGVILALKNVFPMCSL
jgi:hypothetical protein